jgi:hypothetical protein
MSPPKPAGRPATLHMAVREMQADAYERFMANERRRAELLRANAPRAIELAARAVEAIRALGALEASMRVDGLAPTFSDEPSLDDALRAMAAVVENARDAAGAGI